MMAKTLTDMTVKGIEFPKVQQNIIGIIVTVLLKSKRRKKPLNMFTITKTVLFVVQHQKVQNILSTTVGKLF
jgi:hypothetical protein